MNSSISQKIIYKSILLCFVLLTFTSCINLRVNRNRNYLQRFPQQKVETSYNLNQDDVQIIVHKFDAQDCKDYFQVNLIDKSIVPIHLKIINESNNIYVIRPSYIDLQPAEPLRIAKILHWDTSYYVSLMSYLSVMFWWPGIFYAGQAGYDMYYDNKKIDQLIESNALAGQVIEILPFEIIDKFIFVEAADYKDPFILRMFNQTEHKLLTFEIHLSEKTDNTSENTEELESSDKAQIIDQAQVS